jgi:Flp pilus assembly protein TadG
MFNKQHLADPRGSAMLEFVLSLPFLWIVIALALGTGGGWLARHRVQVLTRERALAVTADVTAPDERAGLRQVKASGSFSSSSRGPSLPGGSLMQQMLSRLKATERVCFSGTKRPAASLFRAVRMTDCFEVDTGTWTYAQTQGRVWDTLAASLGSGFGRFADLLR